MSSNLPAVLFSFGAVIFMVAAYSFSQYRKLRKKCSSFDGIFIGELDLEQRRARLDMVSCKWGSVIFGLAAGMFIMFACLAPKSSSTVQSEQWTAELNKTMNEVRPLGAVRFESKEAALAFLKKGGLIKGSAGSLVVPPLDAELFTPEIEDSLGFDKTNQQFVLKLTK